MSWGKGRGDAGGGWSRRYPRPLLTWRKNRVNSLAALMTSSALHPTGWSFQLRFPKCSTGWPTWPILHMFLSRTLHRDSLSNLQCTISTLNLPYFVPRNDRVLSWVIIAHKKMACRARGSWIRTARRLSWYHGSIFFFLYVAWSWQACRSCSGGSRSAQSTRLSSLSTLSTLSTLSSSPEQPWSCYARPWTDLSSLILFSYTARVPSINIIQ
jgi:hypothetical protein